MEWLLIAAFAVGAIVFLRQHRELQHTRSNAKAVFERAEFARKADNASYLAALEREIGNELVRRSAQMYRDRFERLLETWRKQKDLTKDQQQKLLDAICVKYPRFSDFQQNSNWPHVFAQEAYDWKSDDDLWEIYEAVRLFDALSCELDGDWRLHGASITEKECEHVRAYVEKVRDTELLEHLHRARQEYHILSKPLAIEPEGEWMYETSGYKFRRVSHFMEYRIGVYVKELDRYGMWSTFLDHERNVFYTSFYAADANWNEEIIDALDVRIALGKERLSDHETLDFAEGNPA